MPDSLDEQIEAFEALRSSIKNKHGSVWVVIADRRLVKTFPAFSKAAQFARERFGKRSVLIRHTDERAVETVPFVRVRAGQN